VARSETAKAAGLAAATLAGNAIQLIFTIAFTRILGVTDYGSLAVADLGVPDPARRRLGRAGRRGARDGAGGAR